MRSDETHGPRCRDSGDQPPNHPLRASDCSYCGDEDMPLCYRDMSMEGQRHRVRNAQLPYSLCVYGISKGARYIGYHCAQKLEVKGASRVQHSGARIHSNKGGWKRGCWMDGREVWLAGRLDGHGPGQSSSSKVQKKNINHKIKTTG